MILHIEFDIKFERGFWKSLIPKCWQRRKPKGKKEDKAQMKLPGLESAPDNGWTV